MSRREQYNDKFISVEAAAELVKSGDVVGFPIWDHPKEIGMALARRANELRNVTLRGFWTEKYPWHEAGMEESFLVQDVFTFGDTTRKGVWERRIDWVPWLTGLSSNPSRHVEEAARGTNTLYTDVYFCKVTPPNKNGYCSFGRSVWYSPSSLRTAKLAVCQVDPSLIWTYGDVVHVSEIDYLVEQPSTIAEIPRAILPVPPEDEISKVAVIGAHIASLIRDGDTIEVGTGAATEAIFEFLATRNDLGIDSEGFRRQAIDLVRQGVFTGKRKNIDTGKHVAAVFFLHAGDPANQSALDFVDQNPSFELRDCSYIGNVARIAANNNQVAINNALAIDLYGQVAVDHLGPLPITGIGGQLEYTIGSHYSHGGRSITCLISTAKGGTVSRIVPEFEPGTMIGVPAPYVDFLVTEHGMVNLEGKSRRERAEAIISVAHPDFRTELMKAARKRFYP